MVFKVPSKRRRSSSIDTPVLNHSDSIRLSSVACSPPVPFAQSMRNPRQQPSRRVSMLPSRSRGASVNTSSRAVSVASIRQEDNVQPDIGLRADIDGEFLEREANDSLGEVVMAVDLRDRGTVGCCYYIASEERLYMMEDVKSGGIEVIDSRRYCQEGETASY